MSGPAIPTTHHFSLVDALTSEVVEDIDAARLWLASEDVGERDLSLLVRIAAVHAVRCDRRASEAKLRFVQLALARGADPNRLSLVEDPNWRSPRHFARGDRVITRPHTAKACPGTVVTANSIQTVVRLDDAKGFEVYPSKVGAFGGDVLLLTRMGQFHEINLMSEISLMAGPPSLIDLLIRWGADFDHRASKVTKTLENGGKQIFRVLLLLMRFALAIRFATVCSDDDFGRSPSRCCAAGRVWTPPSSIRS